MRNAVVLIGLLSMVASGARAQEKEESSSGETRTGGSAAVQAELRFAPALHIELGSGPNANDVPDLSLDAADRYIQGITWRVEKQLKVFAVGTGYAVNVQANSNARSEEEERNLYTVFALAIKNAGETARKQDLKNISPIMGSLYTGGADGERELDVTYRVRLIADYNIQAFSDLLGKDGRAKPYTIDFTYTIAAN